MKITETTKATIKVTDEEYRTIQTFCRWLNDNLCGLPIDKHPYM